MRFLCHLPVSSFLVYLTSPGDTGPDGTSPGGTDHGSTGPGFTGPWYGLMICLTSCLFERNAAAVFRWENVKK